MYVFAIRRPSGVFALIERETGFVLYEDAERLPVYCLRNLVRLDGHMLVLARSDYHPVYGQYRPGFFWPAGGATSPLPMDWHLGLLQEGDIRFRPHDAKTLLRSEWKGQTWTDEQVFDQEVSSDIYTFMFAMNGQSPVDFDYGDRPTSDRYYRLRQTIISHRIAYEHSKGGTPHGCSVQ